MQKSTKPENCTTTRAARIQAIADAAVTRQHLGQAATHRRLPDGAHVVTFGGVQFIGATVAAAIRAAQEHGR